MSPSYPNFYPPSSNEVWDLEVDEGQQIKLTFGGFSIEPALCEFDYYSGYGYDWEYKDMSKKRDKKSDNTKSDCGECYYDYVKISYGSVEEKYCGSDIPGPIISSGNTMTVTFVCDTVFQFTGFKATWEAVEGGQIQSPNYPDFYPASSDETWDLEVSPGKEIKLTFESFST